MKIGTITDNVKNLLQLPELEDSNIYIGDTNIAHMTTSHPEDYDTYKNELSNILNHPDYVGMNPRDNSIEYVKNYIVNNDYVKVAVRVSASGKHYARSLYVLNKNRVENFIKKGTLKKIDFLSK